MAHSRTTSINLPLYPPSTLHVRLIAPMDQNTHAQADIRRDAHTSTYTCQTLVSDIIHFYMASWVSISLFHSGVCSTRDRLWFPFSLQLNINHSSSFSFFYAQPSTTDTDYFIIIQGWTESKNIRSGKVDFSDVFHYWLPLTRLHVIRLQQLQTSAH